MVRDKKMLCSVCRESVGLYVYVCVCVCMRMHALCVCGVIQRLHNQQIIKSTYLTHMCFSNHTCSYAGL